MKKYLFFFALIVPLLFIAHAAKPASALNIPSSSCSTQDFKTSGMITCGHVTFRINPKEAANLSGDMEAMVRQYDAMYTLMKDITGYEPPQQKLLIQEKCPYGHTGDCPFGNLVVANPMYVWINEDPGYATIYVTSDYFQNAFKLLLADAKRPISASIMHEMGHIFTPRSSTEYSYLWDGSSTEKWASIWGNSAVLMSNEVLGTNYQFYWDGYCTYLHKAPLCNNYFSTLDQFAAVGSDADWTYFSANKSSIQNPYPYTIDMLIQLHRSFAQKGQKSAFLNAFKKTFHFYNASFVVPASWKTSVEQQSASVIREKANVLPFLLSAYAKTDLTQQFSDWKYPITQTTKNQYKQYAAGGFNETSIAQYVQRVIEGVNLEQMPILSEPIVCAQYYDPVCGADGKTYGNDCEADAARTTIAYGGRCKQPSSATKPDLVIKDILYTTNDPNYDDTFRVIYCNMGKTDPSSTLFSLRLSSPAKSWTTGGDMSDLWAPPSGVCGMTDALGSRSIMGLSLEKSATLTAIIDSEARVDEADKENNLFRKTIVFPQEKTDDFHFKSVAVQKLDYWKKPSENKRTFAIEFTHPYRDVTIDIYKGWEQTFYSRASMDGNGTATSVTITPNQFDKFLEPDTMYTGYITAHRAGTGEIAYWKKEHISTSDFAPEPEPTMDFRAEQSTIVKGGQAKLIWNTQNAVRCQSYTDTKINGSWQWDQNDATWAVETGKRDPNGIQILSPQTSTRYWLNCFNNDSKQIVKSVEVAVVDSGSKPTVSLSTDRQKRAKTQSALLTWTSTNASQCTASNGWIGTKATQGSESIAGDSTATYTIECVSSSGIKSDPTSVTVPVVGDSERPTIQVLRADPQPLIKGVSGTLIWQSQNASYCTASGEWEGKKSTFGSESINPAKLTSSYTLQCFNDQGVASTPLLYTPLIMEKTQQEFKIVNIKITPGINTTGTQIESVRDITVTFSKPSKDATLTVTTKKDGVTRTQTTLKATSQTQTEFLLGIGDLSARTDYRIVAEGHDATNGASTTLEQSFTTGETSAIPFSILSVRVDKLDALGNKTEQERSFAVSLSHPFKELSLALFELPNSVTPYTSMKQASSSTIRSLYISPGVFDKKLQPNKTYKWTLSATRLETQEKAISEGEFTTSALDAPKEPRLCAQVLTFGKNKQTGEVRQFPDSCLPDGWEFTREQKQVTALPVIDDGIKKIQEKASLIQDQKFDAILAELQTLRNKVQEQETELKYLKKITDNTGAISAPAKESLNNFITYGVDESTKKLGAGERAAVLSSYKQAFDKLPSQEAEITDMIKIANGRFPSERNTTAEMRAKQDFIRIYKRIPLMTRPTDAAAVMIMSYGLRQRSENRNLASEREGINTYRAIFGHIPADTDDWNTMQAITYSGAVKMKDSDQDSLADDDEKQFGSDSKNPDSDGDGYIDGIEILNGYSPVGNGKI